MFSLDAELQQINLGSSPPQAVLIGSDLPVLKISVRIQPQMCRRSVNIYSACSFFIFSLHKQVSVPSWNASHGAVMLVSVQVG